MQIPPLPDSTSNSTQPGALHANSSSLPQFQLPIEGNFTLYFQHYSSLLYNNEITTNTWLFPLSSVYFVLGFMTSGETKVCPGSPWFARHGETQEFQNHALSLRFISKCLMCRRIAKKVEFLQPNPIAYLNGSHNHGALTEAKKLRREWCINKTAWRDSDALFQFPDPIQDMTLHRAAFTSLSFLSLSSPCEFLGLFLSFTTFTLEVWLLDFFFPLVRHFVFALDLSWLTHWYRFWGGMPLGHSYHILLGW